MALTITLTTPITLNGVKTNKLVMREPTVGDELDLRKLVKDDAERELAMFARLSECAPDDLRKMTLKDFSRVQKGYFRLMADDETATGDVVGSVAPAGN